jgi:hypothetical protein
MSCRSLKYKYKRVYDEMCRSYDLSAISCFRCGVHEIFALLGCYRAQITTKRSATLNIPEEQTFQVMGQNSATYPGKCARIHGKTLLIGRKSHRNQPHHIWLPSLLNNKREIGLILRRGRANR